jgi:hypothetical protein
MEFKKEYGWLFKAKSKDLLYKLLPNVLARFGYDKLTHGKGFMIAEGEIPIMLVAHTDTVHFNPVEEFYYDPEEMVAWSPQGVGADDRAGIFAILEIVRRGLKPFILFTDEEEKGCIGAQKAAKVLGKPNIKYMIELDRKNDKDSVYYQCDNLAFSKYVNAFGFVEATGSSSDIAKLGPAWKLAAVNLSTGYYNAHSKEEYLKVRETLATVDKVCNMLKNVPEEAFEFIEKKYYTGTTTYQGNRDYQTTSGSTTTNKTDTTTNSKSNVTNIDKGKDYRSTTGSINNKVNNDTSITYELGYNLTAWDLVTWFGRDYLYWTNWIKAHQAELEEIERKVELYALDLLEVHLREDIVEEEAQKEYEKNLESFITD